jgi:hypothetical protein
VGIEKLSRGRSMISKPEKKTANSCLIARARLIVFIAVAVCRRGVSSIRHFALKIFSAPKIPVDDSTGILLFI